MDRHAHIRHVCMMRQVWYDAEWEECKGLSKSDLRVRFWDYMIHTHRDGWLERYRGDYSGWNFDDAAKQRRLHENEVFSRKKACMDLLHGRLPESRRGALPSMMYNYDEPRRAPQ